MLFDDRIGKHCATCEGCRENRLGQSMFTNRRAILHVDDDPAICRFVATLLEREGCEVESVTNPLEAMARLEEGQFQVVLLDIDMPNKTGMHLLSEIKAYDAGVQVIMLTGLVGLPTVLETHRLGAEACLFKPVTDPSQLCEAVADAFGRMDRWWTSLRDLTHRRKTYSSTPDTSPSEEQLEELSSS